MSFSTAVSGLNAAANMLSVTGNNIANVNTTGFKNSRSEFADVYSSSLGSGGKTTPGSGVVNTNVAQLFGQGNLQSTGNVLDMAISGEGFFVLGDSVQDFRNHSYTRAGNFHVSQNGYVVSNNEQPLLATQPISTAYPPIFGTEPMPLRLETSEGLPEATTRVDTAVNLDARMTIIDPGVTPFVGPVGGVVDPATYTHASSVTVYDSLGVSHQVTHYFVNRPPAPTESSHWDVYTTVDGLDIKGTAPPAAPAADALVFDSSGRLSSVAGAAGTTTIDYPAFTLPAGGADPLDITLDLRGSTQLGSEFGVNSLSQNGVTTGKLSGIDIDDTGIVFARYTNGQAKPLGKVALVRFDNPQGLTKLGDTRWGANMASGPELNGYAGNPGYGTIKSGSLEGSNVDLSQQLVNLIIAQQAYQANAQTITTENQVVQTLLQIR